MNRLLTFLVGPESVLTGLTLVVYWFCARHGSYASRDVTILERTLWLLPFVAIALAYATFLVPGARSWSWLVRVNIALLIALVVGSVRIIDGFKEPGTGPNGGAIGLLVVICLWILVGSLANSIAAAFLLAEHRPAWAQWFRERKILGGLLIVVSAVPMAFAMSTLTGVAAGIYASLPRFFQR
ncbi:MAG: hypothetical protein JNL10_00535 [Verrucomicrobiales bacterium]|nr:hypothetical protein [Verrucomicrobiales bacterium]